MYEYVYMSDYVWSCSMYRYFAWICMYGDAALNCMYEDYVWRCTHEYVGMSLYVGVFFANMFAPDDRGVK